MDHCHLPHTQSSAALSALARVSASNLSAPSATPMTPSEHSTQKVSTGGSSMNSGRALTLRQYACRTVDSRTGSTVGLAWARCYCGTAFCWHRLPTCSEAPHCTLPLPCNQHMQSRMVPPAHTHLSCPLPPAGLLLLLLRHWRGHNFYD